MSAPSCCLEHRSRPSPFGLFSSKELLVSDYSVYNYGVAHYTLHYTKQRELECTHVPTRACTCARVRSVRHPHHQPSHQHQVHHHEQNDLGHLSQNWKPPSPHAHLSKTRNCWASNTLHPMLPYLTRFCSRTYARRPGWRLMTCPQVGLTGAAKCHSTESNGQLNKLVIKAALGLNQPLTSPNASETAVARLQKLLAYLQADNLTHTSTEPRVKEPSLRAGDSFLKSTQTLSRLHTSGSADAVLRKPEAIAERKNLSQIDPHSG